MTSLTARPTPLCRWPTSPPRSRHWPAQAGGRSSSRICPNSGRFQPALACPRTSAIALDQLTLAYDSLLSSTLAQLRSSLGVTIGQVDLERFVTDVRADPSAYGFTNTTTSALGDGVLSGDGYLFWDEVHPTTAGHKFIGDLAFRVRRPRAG